jgi:tungstate transport system substrate-binding protein
MLLAGCGAQSAQSTQAASATEAAQVTETARPPQTLRLATTTSTQDSGLLDVILPDFEQKFNAKVEVLAVGTGEALEAGKRGDADVVLVHARSQEDQFVKDGFGTQRYDVMYNDFVIVGPASDPAGIRGMTDAAAALKAIAAAGQKFISRGDKSGTNTREIALWKAAGIEPSGAWYESAGQGMGEVLTMAQEQQAYTLSDRATYLKRQADGLKLDVLVEGDKALLNPYGVIPVNPAKNPSVNADLAQKFVEWITSPDTQKMIGDYKINGQILFTPDAGK